jgi:nitroreductase
LTLADADDSLALLQGSPMDALDAIYHRRSVRDFTAAPVGDEAVRAVVDAAIQAPNAEHQEAWSFVVVRDAALLARIGQAAKALVLEQTAGQAGREQIRERLASPDFNIFYNAPALVVVCATAPETMALQSCYLAAQNLMLAAHAHGLGGCWIGLAEAWLATAEGREALGLAEGESAVAPIILGHPRAAPPEQHRRPARIRWI